ncbi:MAG: radical SAM protein [Chloroflexota bacterium]|nr:radical SAM protein [Chloroflexota bacterium]MDE2895273.1 radical SAM protein [Chloroflexota bacterium]
MPIQVDFYNASQILTPGAGYLGEYDYSLNPYVGCSFGCSYCYAAFFAPPEQQASWGDWVRVKQNAALKLSRIRRSLAGKTIYLSSATDPYQPIERRLQLTRSLLPILAEKGAHLVVQTRSPLVTRDIDLLQRFDRACVNFSITTDSEAVRRAFEPRNPPIQDRLQAAREIAEAGIPVAITMTPLLPVVDVVAFAERVSEAGARRFVIDRFAETSGHFRAGTGETAQCLAEQFGWSGDRFREAVELLTTALAPNIRAGEAGFSPSYLLSSPAPR